MSKGSSMIVWFFWCIALVGWLDGWLDGLDIDTYISFLLGEEGREESLVCYTRVYILLLLVEGSH